MKKITLFLLVLCLVFSTCILTACAPSSTDLISKAVEKTSKLDSYKADLDIDMDIKVQGTTVSMPISMSMKVEGLQGDAPQVEGDLNMTVMDQKIEMDVYSDGKWSYFSTSGQKYKQKIDEENKSYSDTANSLLQDIPEDVLKDVEPVKNDDGSYTIEFEMDSEQFKEVFEEAIKSAESSSGSAEEGSVDIDDAKIKIVIDDEYIKTYEISFDMSMKVSGQTAEASVEMSIEFKDYNGEYNIEPPTDYKKYKELPKQ